jgi:hypothetical protein
MFGGEEIPPEWDFDSDSVIGRKVILCVIKRQGDNNTEYNKIDAVLPFKKKPVAPPKPAPVANDYGEDD